MTYDSRPDTWAHIHEVQSQMEQVVNDLSHRALVHDQSKLVEPELSIFDVFTPRLKTTTYMSPEYKRDMEEMRVALDHHYAVNSHHPQHYPDGIRGMSLLDLIEMVCDWIAACKRHDDGNIYKSIEDNQERFGYSDELKGILLNTVEAMNAVPATA